MTEIYFCPLLQFTQDAVSDFLCFQSQSILAPVTDYQWPHLFTEGWGIRCWRKMESSKSHLPLQKSGSQLGGGSWGSSLLGSQWRPPEVISQSLETSLQATQAEGDRGERPHNSHTENNYSDPTLSTKLWERSCKQRLANRNISIMHCSLL